MNNQYDSMTLANLRELAKEKGLKNISAMKKSELAEALAKTASEERVPTEKTEPKAAEPRAAETKITELKAAEPRTAESKKTEPRITGPRITEPRISEPRASEPRGAEPRVTEQRLTEPRVTEPKIAEAADQNSSAGREERRPSANSNEVDQLDSGETKVGFSESGKQCCSLSRYLLRSSGRTSLPDYRRDEAGCSRGNRCPGV
jgi:hypothetical protein